MANVMDEVAYSKECLKCKNHPMNGGKCQGKPRRIEYCLCYDKDKKYE